MRPIETVRVFARSRESVQALIEELGQQTGLPGDICLAASPGEAVQGADIVCTTTTSKTPVFDDADLSEGVHINAVGSYTPGAAEIPPETVLRARVIVDEREAAWEEAGDLIQPFEAGQITRDHVQAEMGELVSGTASGRENDQQVTLFKSVGLAVEDALAARVTLANATALNRGQSVSW